MVHCCWSSGQGECGDAVTVAKQDGLMASMQQFSCYMLIAEPINVWVCTAADVPFDTCCLAELSARALRHYAPCRRSMRKTRLLLDAVAQVGCRDVTFAALDLCEDSLSEALTALQGNTVHTHCVTMGQYGYVISSWINMMPQRSRAYCKRLRLAVSHSAASAVVSTGLPMHLNALALQDVHSVT